MLARADSTDYTVMNLTLVFSSLLVIGVAAFLGFLIFRAARLNRRAQAEGFAALAILWVIASAGAVIHDLSVQSKWSHEAADRLASGYYTPAEVNADAPRHPYPLFIALAAIYPGLLLLASRPIRYASQSRTSMQSDPAQSETPPTEAADSPSTLTESSDPPPAPTP